MSIEASRHNEFHCFATFPSEMQLKIWSFAIPNPRKTLGAMCLITDFALSTPRAILPSPREMALVYEKMGEEGIPDLDSYSDGEDWSLSPAGVHSEEEMTDNLVQSWAGILALMHTSHKSRSETREIFRLQSDSEPWWGNGAMIWFPMTAAAPCRKSATLSWLSLARSQRLPLFTTLNHLTLHLDNDVLSALLDTNSAWTTEYPALESITLAFDSAGVGNKEDGMIVLYECKDVRVMALTDHGQPTPSQVAGRVTRHFKNGGQVAPLVECAVMCWRKPKISRG